MGKILCAGAESADDMNIPVNIWLIRIDEVEEDSPAGVESGWWELVAGCYMPRKCRVMDEHFRFYAADRETLAQLVVEQWVPLYEAALTKLKAFGTSTGESDLYFWQADHGDE